MALAQEAFAFKQGRGNWDRVDAATKVLLKDAGVKPQDLRPWVSDYSMSRWFDDWTPSWTILNSWNDHQPVVYFVSTDDGRKVKIGTTRRIRYRLAVLRSNMPTLLRLEAAFPGSYEMEGRLHRLFKADRIRGEWFNRTQELERLIRVSADAYGIVEP